MFPPLGGNIFLLVIGHDGVLGIGLPKLIPVDPEGAVAPVFDDVEVGPN